MVPSVMTMVGRSKATANRPFSAPSAVANTSPISTHSHGFSPVVVISSAMIPMVAFSTMPTDRSTSLAQNTKVMAKVRMPRILICLRITDMLPPVIKAGTNTAKPTITAISASNTPLSLKLSSFFSRCSRESLASCAASAGADCSCAAVRSTLSPAMYLSIVPLVVPAGTVLMCFPLRNRSISSLRAVSSSISDEVSTTAKPCRVMRSMS